MKKVIFWLIFLWGFTQGSFAQSKMSSDEYIKQVTSKNIDKTRKWIQQKDKQVYNIFNNLCDSIIEKDSVTIIPEGMTYNPKQSVFVTIFCNSIKAETKDKTAKISEEKLPINKILKRKNIRDMGIICSQKQLSTNPNDNIGDTYCENRSFDNNLDYPFIFQKIITQVQNDRVNLSLARIYGTIDSKLTEKELANEYIKNHFNTIGLIPEAKNYPDTHKRLTNYIKNGKTIQKETYFIKYSNITDDTKSSIGGNIADFFSINSASKTPPNYHKINTDILYNELFFYTLFTSVYTEYLNRFWEKNTGNIPISRKQRNISEWEATILQRWRIDIYTESIKNAIRESIRQLWNLESSYPIHIWFLMYQEDLLTMRDNLAKIYLPLHQLHYKLENVQSKN